MQRFHSGGGELLDVEFIVNEQGQYNIVTQSIQSKVAVVERWPLWGGSGVIRTISFREYNMFIVLNSC